MWHEVSLVGCGKIMTLCRTFINQSCALTEREELDVELLPSGYDIFSFYFGKGPVAGMKQDNTGC